MRGLYFALIGALFACLVWSVVFLAHANEDAARQVNTMTHAIERTI